MARLDHIAYRVADRKKTAAFFMEAFGYRFQTEFEIQFADGSRAECIALEPPEKLDQDAPWLAHVPERNEFRSTRSTADLADAEQEYHMPPEIFISDGNRDSIVGQWVAARGGVGGIHHLAYQVVSVADKMREWQEKGYAEFTTEAPLTCPDLTQVFTKPSELTGVIYEFIERGKHGFCKDNVKDLMESTKDCS